MRLSNRTFRREGREQDGFSLLDFAHGYVCARSALRVHRMAKGDHSPPWVVRPAVGIASRWMARRSANQAAGKALPRGTMERDSLLQMQRRWCHSRLRLSYANWNTSSPSPSLAMSCSPIRIILSPWSVLVVQGWSIRVFRWMFA